MKTVIEAQDAIIKVQAEQIEQLSKFIRALLDDYTTLYNATLK